MIEPKVSLSLFVQGANMISQQEAENKPSESYNENKVFTKYYKGKGKNTKVVTEVVTFHTRKNRTVTQNINISEEAYNYMLENPTSTKFTKRVKVKGSKNTKRIWDTFSIDEKLKKHFDLIANDLHAHSYSYEILK